MTYLGVELVENVLEVVSLDGFFGVEELEELLDKLRSYINLEGSDFNSFVNDQLQEEFVNSLKMRPGWIHLFFLVNTSLSESEVVFLHIWEWSEDVLLNHLHDLVQVGNDETAHILLILEHHLQLGNCIQTICFGLDILRLVLVIKGAHAKVQFLDEGLLGVLGLADLVLTVALGRLLLAWFGDHLRLGALLSCVGSHYLLYSVEWSEGVYVRA